jgi:hypothetical protein
MPLLPGLEGKGIAEEFGSGNGSDSTSCVPARPVVSIGRDWPLTPISPWRME